MSVRFSLSYKLIGLIFVTIVVTLVLSGFALDTLFKRFYENAADEKIKHGFHYLATQLKKTEQTMTSDAEGFASDESVVASINMITSYQDKENYRAIIFDPEKQKLAHQLLEIAKLSLCDFAAIYEADGHISAFAGMEEGRYYEGFLAFGKGGEHRLHVKFEEETGWHSGRLPGFIEEELGILQNQGHFLLNAGNLVYKKNTKRFVLEVNRAIVRDLYRGKQKGVGYLKLVKVYDESFIQNFSQSSGSLSAFIVDDRHTIGALEGIETGRLIKEAELLFTKNLHERFDLIEQSDYLLHSHVLPAVNGNIYFLVGYSKDKLNMELNKTRYYLMMIMLVVAVVMFPLSIYYINQLITRPVFKLVDAVQSAEAGDYRAVETLKTEDELALLSEMFNKMAATIQQRELELQESAQSLKDAQRIAHMGNWRLDLTTRKTYWSDEIYRIYELEPQSIIPDNESFLNFVHADDRKTVAEAVHDAMANASEKEFSFRIITAKGNEKILNTKARPEFDDQGNLIAYIGINHDVTDIKKVQQELEAYKNKLELMVSEEITKRMEQEQLLIQQSKLAAMGEMIGNIAHQWRQPLNTLGLKIQDIEDAYNFGELNKEYIEQTVVESMAVIKKMSETINDFANFFKPNRKKSDFTVKEALDEALGIVGASLKNNGIELVVKTESEKTIRGFLNEYSHVLINIINNAKDALKKAEHHDKKITVAIREDETGHSVVSICDNGGGIPEEIIDKVFDPYFTTKHKAEGTGIGLYMSKMIIERNMQGSIRAENVEGGARFVITV